jgi:glycosyltransferase involved in cell wall biosynthesis
MSNTIMESMAAGKPMVATNVGGNAELIVEGETGFLVPVRDPAALAAAIQLLLDDPARTQYMGKQAKARISQLFSTESLTVRTEHLYDELVESSQGARLSTARSSASSTEEPTTAFVVSQFPRYVDAYFLREIAALAARGLRFQIFSLLNFNGKVTHNDAQTLLPRTFYIPFFFSWKLWQAQMHFLWHTPGRYFAALWLILRGSWRRPRLLLRSLAVFPKSVYFAKVAQDHGVAHVHANWASHPAASALVISRLTGTPWSFSGHASDIYVDTTMLAEKVRAAKFVVTCTRYNKSYLTEVAGPEAAKKIVVSYHGVDLQKFVPAPKQPSERFQILAVGTLLPCKGLPDLIEACRLLAERGVAFDCTIAGDGPERRLLEQQIHRCGLNDRVKILGYVAQETLIPLYQQAGVVALPALSESHFGIPNVLLEAMAVKTPVICTPLPSLSEVMKDGQQGVYVPEHDPKALADALEKLARNPALCRDMGKLGRGKIEELFDTEKNVGTLETLFRPSGSVRQHENMVTIDVVMKHADA